MKYKCLKCGKKKEGKRRNLDGTRCECGGPIIPINND